MDENTSGTAAWGPNRIERLIWAWQEWMNAQRKGAPRLELIAAEQALRDIANATD
jgi:hypothetical protein